MAGTSDLVVPYGDCEQAAQIFCKLAEDTVFYSELSKAVEEQAKITFDMAAYVSAVDELGHKAAKAEQSLSDHLASSCRTILSMQNSAWAKVPST